MRTTSLRAVSATTALFVSVVCFAGLARSQGESGPVTVFIAREIVTMDPGWPRATAVAVRGGRILSVGSLDDLKPWLKAAPYKIDRTFADKILLPGFVDAHGHPLLGGTSITRPLLTYLPTPSPYGPEFPGVKTQAEAAAKLTEYVKQAKSPDQTILVWGYDVIAMGGKHLDKTMLDKISTTQPLLVWDASEHFVYANTAALTKYKVTRDSTKTEGIMAGADGEPNGQILGTTAAQPIIAAALAEVLKPDVAMGNVRFLMDLSRQNGITTTSELSYGVVNLPLEELVFDKYFNDPNSPMRCVAVPDVASAITAKGDQAMAFVKSLPARNTDKLIFNGAKFYADDSFLSLGMAMENPGYTDNREGIYIVQPDKMVETWRPWWEAGFQLHIHANGNGAIRTTLDALEALQQIKPRTNHRTTLQHFGMASMESVLRLARLGGVASVNPSYVYARSEFNAPYVGSDRAYTAARLKSLVDAGVPTTLHADTPVSPPKPLELVWIAVNRFGLSGEVRGPEERIGVHQALRMVTIDAAFSLGVEDKVGSIAAGKLADFAVLEQDPYVVPSEKIRDIKVWGTVVGGQVFPASTIRP
jgi:predicted amidohydrolase YtcJ